MRSRLYVHLAWTTRDREPVLDAGLARFLCRFLRGTARKERAAILAMGLVQTHVHLLVELHPTTAVASLVKRLKGASSAVARTERHGLTGKRLYWAKGYNVQSVGVDQLERVRLYLAAQPVHHPLEVIAGWTGDTVDPNDRVGDAAPLRPPEGGGQKLIANSTDAGVPQTRRAKPRHELIRAFLPQTLLGPEVAEYI
ncbi:MAG TPA: IS200/IS605 family transposase, partial [Gemmatimonadales bacterium]|nr:IS200/IS605 family transposase [Gemmatimonadales bacterium]